MRERNYTVGLYSIHTKATVARVVRVAYLCVLSQSFAADRKFLLPYPLFMKNASIAGVIGQIVTTTGELSARQTPVFLSYAKMQTLRGDRGLIPAEMGGILA